MAAAAIGLTTTMDDMPTAVKSELLCFITSKTAIMTFDDIVEVCTSFYRDDEVIDARLCEW